MADATDGSEPVTVTFIQSEALVLFEWLSVSEGRHVFSDQAEQRVLWDLEASLEPRVEALLSADYTDRLHSARARVRDRAD